MQASKPGTGQEQRRGSRYSVHLLPYLPRRSRFANAGRRERDIEMDCVGVCE